MHFLWGHAGVNLYKKHTTQWVTEQRNEWETLKRETHLWTETLFINVLLVCDVLYDLLGGHQLLGLSVWDLEACGRNAHIERVKFAVYKMYFNTPEIVADVPLTSSMQLIDQINLRFISRSWSTSLDELHRPNCKIFSWKLLDYNFLTFEKLQSWRF